MTQPAQFEPGDAVVHPRRPEWGQGVVRQAIAITHEGRKAQRLVVDFANHGRVTINTGVATLVAKDAYLAMSTSARPSSSVTPPAVPAAASRPAAGANGRGWLEALEAPGPGGNELTRLSEAMTDPFLPLAKRLEATLESFRFGSDPRHARNVLDWAVGQTRLNDPMTRYTRHELEEGFRRYVHQRDDHVFDLVRTIRKQGRGDLLEEALKRTANALARTTLERAIRA